MMNRLLCLFEKSENKPLNVKDIFSAISAVKHPAKMQVIECLSDLVLDDYLTTDGNGTYPKRRPPYETAFIFVDDDEFEYQVPSWAMKLVLETSDITEEVLI